MAVTEGLRGLPRCGLHKAGVRWGRLIARKWILGSTPPMTARVFATRFNVWAVAGRMRHRQTSGAGAVDNRRCSPCTDGRSCPSCSSRSRSNIRFDV